MSGPLHAIMRGQYAQSFQSADERTRNRAAAAVVLGTVLIGGAIYVVTKDGKFSLSQFVGEHSVTHAERQANANYKKEITELKRQLSEQTVSGQEASTRLETCIAANADLTAKLEQKAADLTLLLGRLTSHEHEVERQKGLLATCQEISKTAEAEAKTASANATLHLNTIKELSDKNLKLSTDSSKLEATTAELAHEKAKGIQLTEAMKKAKEDLKNSRAENERTRDELVESKRLANLALENVKATTVELDRQKRNSEDLAKTLEAERNESKRVQDSLRQAELRAGDAEEKHARLLAENIKLDSRLRSHEKDTAELAELRAAAKENKAKIDALTRSLNDATKKSASLTNVMIDVERLRVENNRLEGQVEKAREEALKDKGTIAELRDETTRLEAQTTAMAALKQNVGRLQGLLNDAIRQQTADQEKILSYEARSQLDAKFAALAEDAASAYAEVLADAQMDMAEMCSRTQRLLAGFMERNAYYVSVIRAGMEELAVLSADNIFLTTENRNLSGANEKLRQSQDTDDIKRDRAVTEAVQSANDHKDEIVALLQNEIKELKDRSGATAADVTTLREEKESLQIQLEKARGATRRHAEEAKRLKESVDLLEKKYGALETDHATYKMMYEEMEETLANERKRLGDDVARLESEKANLAKEVALLEGENVDLGKDVTRLQGENAEHAKNARDVAVANAKLSAMSVEQRERESKDALAEATTLRQGARTASSTIIFALLSVISDMAAGVLTTKPVGWLQKETAELKSMQIYSHDDAERLDKVLSDTIGVAITSSGELAKLRLAEQNYSRALGCMDISDVESVLGYKLGSLSAAEEQIEKTRQEMETTRQEYNHASWELGNMTRERDNMTRERDQARDALGDAVKKRDDAVHERDEYRKGLSGLSSAIVSMGSVEDIRAEIQTLIADNPTLNIDQIPDGVPILTRDDVLRFLEGKFNTGLGIVLYSRLLQRRVRQMADQLIQIVTRVCNPEDRYIPRFEVGKATEIMTLDNEIKALDKWAANNIDNWLARHRGDDRRTAGHVHHSESAEPYSGRRKLSNATNPTQSSEMDASFGANPACFGSACALRKYFEVQRLVLACVITAARASAISRAEWLMPPDFGPRLFQRKRSFV
jgi:chromosome segregation ATPase